MHQFSQHIQQNTFEPVRIERLHFHGNQKLRNDRTQCRHIVVQVLM